MSDKSRGALGNVDHRFQQTVHRVDEYCEAPEPAGRIKTQLIALEARSILTQNQSPDVPFDQSINPYQGCEHGCIYCFARPSHAYLDHSPGIDFETKIYWKTNAEPLLRAKLRSRRYECKVIALGANTDPYQPSERNTRLTRRILRVLGEHQHPVSIVTKSPDVLRDLDVLAPMAEQNLVSVMISVTTLDSGLKRCLEPRAPSGRKRLEAIAGLAEKGIPVGVLAAPMIPRINDCELEEILTQSKAAGASTAGYVLLRLPWEIKALFQDWLTRHYPDRANSVFSILKQCHEGKTYRSEFGVRQRGQGPFADLLASRFELCSRKLGMSPDRHRLTTRNFVRDPGATRQMGLF